MQDDGNLVLYGPGYHVYWASNTGGTQAGYVVLQPDGNLVMYMPDGQTAVWSNGKPGSGSTYWVIQPDGNLVAYTAQTQATWASQTAGRI